MKAEEEYDQVRTKIKNLINAKRSSEIVFTSGATESLNMIVNGFMRYYLKKDDEVIISKSEHASNVLPWFRLANLTGAVIKYIPFAVSSRFRPIVSSNQNCPIQSQQRRRHTCLPNVPRTIPHFFALLA